MCLVVTLIALSTCRHVLIPSERLQWPVWETAGGKTKIKHVISRPPDVVAYALQQVPKVPSIS